MEITEVRVKLVKDEDTRLKAFCSITLDNEFVVRDIKVIESPHGHFVSMPSRKKKIRCSSCGSKNLIYSHYCNNCGEQFPESDRTKDGRFNMQLYADIAHPINARCRQKIQERVLRAFEDKVSQTAKSPEKEQVAVDSGKFEDDEDIPQVI